MEKQSEFESLQAFLDEIASLKQARLEVNLRFWKAVQAFEAQPALWRTTAVTYDDFLKKYDICQPQRYRNALRTFDLVDQKSIKEIGVRAATCVAAIRDDSDRKKATRELVLKARERGFPPSQQQAQNAVRRVQPPKRKPTEAEVIGRLRSKVRRLEARNRRLEKQLAERDQIIADLRKKHGETGAA